MKNNLVGKRVELISCADVYAPLSSGLRGTVIAVDDLGTLHVHWDNGRSLGLVPNEDLWKVIG